MKVNDKMKVKFKKGRYDFIHEGVEGILENNIDALSTLDLLRYRNIYNNRNSAEYNVYKTLYKNCEKYFLVESNISIIEIDENKYSILCLVHADDVEEVRDRDIEVGDKVKVINDGLIYSTYGDFFTENNLEPYLMINYQYNNSNIDMDDKYVVEYIGTHISNNRKICVIKEVSWSRTSGKVYLIEIDGLKKVD